MMVKTETKPKHFLTITDLTPNELQAVLDAAVELKTRGWIATLKNKTMALVFEKPSLRTRVSFEVAMRQMGGQSLYLSPEEVGSGQTGIHPGRGPGIEPLCRCHRGAHLRAAQSGSAGGIFFRAGD